MKLTRFVAPLSSDRCALVTVACSQPRSRARSAAAPAAAAAASATKPTFGRRHRTARGGDQESAQGDAPRLRQAGGGLFSSMNCDGCHGGGAAGWVGPSLVDGRWRYGGADEEIFYSIFYGRPKGMPAYGGVIGAEGVWMLVGVPQESVATERRADHIVRRRKRRTSGARNTPAAARRGDRGAGGDAGADAHEIRLRGVSCGR